MLHNEKPGSPSDLVLEHHGIKGMKWGVRKEIDLAGRTSNGAMVTSVPKVSRRSVNGQRFVSKKVAANGSVHLPPGSQKNRDENGNATKHEHIGGLSPTQKKLLLAAGVGVAVGGFVAYNHFVGNAAPKPISLEKMAEAAKRLPDGEALKHGPISSRKLGELASTHDYYHLKNPENLMVDVSKGYADIQHVDGFRHEAAKIRHDEMAHTLEVMREKFPAVRNMNIELVPMSEVKGMEASLDSALAAVIPVGPGEARIMFNDVKPALTRREIQSFKSWAPAILDENGTGFHEMGHVLATSRGLMPPYLDVLQSNSDTFVYLRNRSNYHRDMLTKHGLSFKELGKISGYAKTSPEEALAELAGQYFTPSFRAKMDPQLAAKAEALFNDLGGVT